MILAVDTENALLMASPSPAPSKSYRTYNLVTLQGRAERSATCGRRSSPRCGRTVASCRVDAYGPLTFDGFAESPHFGGDISLATAEEIADAVHAPVSRRSRR